MSLPRNVRRTGTASRPAGFVPTPASNVGYASTPAPSTVAYIPPEQNFGSIGISGNVTKDPAPKIYGSMPMGTRAGVPLYHLDVDSTRQNMQNVRHSGTAIPSSTTPQLGFAPGEAEGVVQLHQRGRAYPTATVEQVTPEGAERLVQLQNPTDMGLYVQDLSTLEPDERSTLYEGLYAAGAMVFTPNFIARMQRWVWPCIIFAILAFLGALGEGIAGVVLVVGQVDFDLRIFLMTIVIYNFVVVALGLALTSLEYGRKNSDLSPWHRKRMFMPTFMAVIMALLAIITLAVHNKVDGSDIHRDSISDYSSLTYCMVIMIMSPVLIGRELVPAIISAIYPECEGPELMTLAPDGLARINNQYLDILYRASDGRAAHAL